MENASKALLIAGAILIVILLIAVGMLVYSKSRGVVDTGVAQMNSAEITMYNSQFINYEGTQDDIVTKKLLQTILNHNIKYKDDKSKWIYSTMYTADKSSGTTGYGTRGSFPGAKINYDKLIYLTRNLMEYIDASIGNKKFTIYIYYSEEGLVNQIRIVQDGAEWMVSEL